MLSFYFNYYVLFHYLEITANICSLHYKVQHFRVNGNCDASFLAVGLTRIIMLFSDFWPSVLTNFCIPMSSFSIMNAYCGYHFYCKNYFFVVICRLCLENETTFIVMIKSFIGVCFKICWNFNHITTCYSKFYRHKLNIYSVKCLLWRMFRWVIH